MDHHRAVVLQHEQPQGLRQHGVQAAGVHDLAAGDDQAHPAKLAVRADAPIFAAEAVIEESAIEFEQEDVNEEEVVEEFKKFLDEVKPEDFSTES